MFHCKKLAVTDLFTTVFILSFSHWGKSVELYGLWNIVPPNQFLLHIIYRERNGGGGGGGERKAERGLKWGHSRWSKKSGFVSEVCLKVHFAPRARVTEVEPIISLFRMSKKKYGSVGGKQGEREREREREQTETWFRINTFGFSMFKYKDWMIYYKLSVTGLQSWP